ncbi:RGN, partial [Symbiodinium sp. KB8]
MAEIVEYTAEKYFGRGGRPRVVQDMLGESPCWDHRTDTLYWVDIAGMAICSYEDQPKKLSRWQIGEQLGFVAVTDDLNVLIFGGAGGLSLFRKADGHITRLYHPEQRVHPNNRFNDGKIDPAGRLFAGTMDMYKPRQEGVGALYCMQCNTLKKVEAVGPVTVANGLGWSPDNLTFYHTDSPTRAIRAFSFDIRTGAVHGPAKTAFSTAEGVPDGMCVDSEGFLWVANLRAAQVLRVNPTTGHIVARVRLPVPLVTSVCFGGPYFRTLFITTAMGTTDVDIAECTDANAGYVYAVEVDIPGMPMSPLKLDGREEWLAGGGSLHLGRVGILAREVMALLGTHDAPRSLEDSQDVQPVSEKYVDDITQEPVWDKTPVCLREG